MWFWLSALFAEVQLMGHKTFLSWIWVVTLSQSKHIVNTDDKHTWTKSSTWSNSLCAQAHVESSWLIRMDLFSPVLFHPYCFHAVWLSAKSDAAADLSEHAALTLFINQSIRFCTFASFYRLFSCPSSLGQVWQLSGCLSPSPCVSETTLAFLPGTQRQTQTWCDGHTVW